MSIISKLQESREKLIHQDSRLPGEYTIIVPNKVQISGLHELSATNSYKALIEAHPSCGVYMFHLTEMYMFHEPKNITGNLTEGTRKFASLRPYNYQALVHGQLDTDNFNLRELV